MVTRLILLGILAHSKKPIHGYEIKQVLKRWAVGEYANISYGSIYYNLEKMEKEGLVQSKTVRDSKRPERKLYTITNKGRKEFVRLLRKNYFEIEKIFFKFDVGVGFMPALPKKDVLEALNRRIKYVENMIEMHRKVRDKIEKTAPFFAVAILDHHLIHWEAERKWLINLKEEVEKREKFENWL